MKGLSSRREPIPVPKSALYVLTLKSASAGKVAADILSPTYVIFIPRLKMSGVIAESVILSSASQTVTVTSSVGSTEPLFVLATVDPLIV